MGVRTSCFFWKCLWRSRSFLGVRPGLGLQQKPGDSLPAGRGGGGWKGRDGFLLVWMRCGLPASSGVGRPLRTAVLALAAGAAPDFRPYAPFLLSALRVLPGDAEVVLFTNAGIAHPLVQWCVLRPPPTRCCMPRGGGGKSVVFFCVFIWQNLHFFVFFLSFFPSENIFDWCAKNIFFLKTTHFGLNFCKFSVISALFFGQQIA